MKVKVFWQMLWMIGMGVLISGMVFLGCDHGSDSTPTTTTGRLSFADVSNSVFVRCSPCHLNGGNSGNLDLSAYGNIVNVPSSQRPDLMRISPNNPDSSYIYMKVIGAEGIIGDQMPQGGQLTDDQISTLRTWIEDGAPETVSDPR